MCISENKKLMYILSTHGYVFTCVLLSFSRVLRLSLDHVQWLGGGAIHSEGQDTYSHHLPTAGQCLDSGHGPEGVVLTGCPEIIGI